jgi:hypothetical protein
MEDELKYIKVNQSYPLIYLKINYCVIVKYNLK